MLELLKNNPLLLLFTVAAIGYPLGRIKIGGSSLGVAAVLFVGLAIGSLDQALKLPEIVYMLGLALFVYTVGLSSGPGFVASFRREGLRYNGVVVGVIILATLLCAAICSWLQLKSTLAAGMLAGSLTNTPALAGALESVKSLAPQGLLEQSLAEPIVAYSVTYPMGILGMILAMTLMQRIWKVDFRQEAQSNLVAGERHDALLNRTVLVTRPAACRGTIEDLCRNHGWDVIFGRFQHAGQLALAARGTRLAAGDRVTIVGTLANLERVTAFLGEESDVQLELDRSEFYFRRIFVSNPRVAGRRLQELGVQERFDAIVTRVKRGDMDFLPHDNTVLELGDRVRVVTHRDRMGEVSRFFGDSYRAVSEIDILSFSLGLALGLLLGILPIPFPGGLTIRLGFAGGPLVMALLLGTLERTGSMVWSLPYSANLTLRQIGLIMFLAGIGTRAGYSFVSTFATGGGILIFATGAAITTFTALVMLWIGYRLLHIPMSILLGMLAGLQTQPALLGYTLEQTRNDLPNLGYAAVYPLATIAKILCVQLLLFLLPLG